MAVYKGIGGVARRNTQGWIGVSGVARRVFSKQQFLYNLGDECSSITGGWAKGGYARGSATVTKNSDHILLKSTSSGNQTVTVFTKNKINLTNYSKLYIEFQYTTTVNDQGYTRLLIDDAIENKADAQIDYLDKINSYTGTMYMNISNRNTSYYVGVQIDHWSSSKAVNTLIKRVWLE